LLDEWIARERAAPAIGLIGHSPPVTSVQSLASRRGPAMAAWLLESRLPLISIHGDVGAKRHSGKPRGRGCVGD
jgi:hypothetical protein